MASFGRVWEWAAVFEKEREGAVAVAAVFGRLGEEKSKWGGERRLLPGAEES